MARIVLRVLNTHRAGDQVMQSLHPKYVMGPEGRDMTLGDLPRSNNQRWLPLQKANVVFAVRGGLLSIEEACQRYRLTTEEFASWERAIDRDGIKGLRVTWARPPHPA